MTDHDTTPTPLQVSQRALDHAWNSVSTVYWANSLSWRVLKSGALVFFGFFLWAGSNLLLSYLPGLTVLHYPMAYGFVLLVYGPVHHAVVIPLAIRLRKRGGDYTSVGRHLPKAGLAVFLAAVVVLGTAPASPMLFDFGSTLSAGGVDVNPGLTCTKSVSGGEAVVHCHLTESAGIDSIVVESGGDPVVTDDTPPFEFTVRESELATVTGQKQFQVVLRDADGDTLRRYTRTVSMVPSG
jgi:hypothetical protein